MITARRRQRHQPKADPTVAIAYTRVSSDEQRTLAQRDDIERWSRAHGVRIAAWHTDEGVSGAAPLDERLGLLDALTDVRQHRAGLLLFWKRDRIARDVSTAAAIERLAREAGAQIATADGVDSSDTPEGQLLRTLLDAMAQYERALIRARTKAALRAKHARGERTGSVPFGFASDDGRLVPLEQEQAALARMRELAAAGSTQQQIADALGAEGFRPRGAKWNVTTVARALRRE